MKPKPLPKDRNTTILLCSIVNRYNRGDMPVVSSDNLKFVQPGYLYECVEKTVAAKMLTETGNRLAKAWMEQKP